MKDPSDSIRQWLFNILNNTISYSGSYIPCYSFVPKDASKPSIIIGEQYMEADESTKDSWITVNSVVLEIYASYSGNDASYKLINSVGEDVLELVTAEPLTSVGSGSIAVTTVTGYDVISVMVQSIATERILFDNEIVLMKSIIIKLTLEEE